MLLPSTMMNWPEPSVEAQESNQDTEELEFVLPSLFEQQPM
jgi:hypothetical protein